MTKTVTKRNKHHPFTAMWWHENTVNAMMDLIICQTMGLQGRTEKYAKLAKYCDKRTQEAIERAVQKQKDNCIHEYIMSTQDEEIVFSMVQDAIESAKQPRIK